MPKNRNPSANPIFSLEICASRQQSNAYSGFGDVGGVGNGRLSGMTNKGVIAGLDPIACQGVRSTPEKGNLGSLPLTCLDTRDLARV